MRAVIQRVQHAHVEVNNEIIGEIGQGIVVLLAVHEDDTEEDIRYFERKIPQMRIFSDDQGKMNLSVLDIKGEILLISQFTLYGNCKKGNRPSFIESARPTKAEEYYEILKQKLSQILTVQSGSFGSDMKVSLVNDGPVTIILDSHV